MRLTTWLFNCHKTEQVVHPAAATRNDLVAPTPVYIHAGEILNILRDSNFFDDYDGNEQSQTRNTPNSGFLKRILQRR